MPSGEYKSGVCDVKSASGVKSCRRRVDSRLQTPDSRLYQCLQTLAENFAQRLSHRVCGFADGDGVNSRSSIFEIESRVDDLELRIIEMNGAAHGEAGVN